MSPIFGAQNKPSPKRSKAPPRQKSRPAAKKRPLVDQQPPAGISGAAPLWPHQTPWAPVLCPIRAQWKLALAVKITRRKCPAWCVAVETGKLGGPKPGRVLATIRQIQGSKKGWHVVFIQFLNDSGERPEWSAPIFQDRAWEYQVAPRQAEMYKSRY